MVPGYLANLSFKGLYLFKECVGHPCYSSLEAHPGTPDIDIPSLSPRVPSVLVLGACFGPGE